MRTDVPLAPLPNGPAKEAFDWLSARIATQGPSALTTFFASLPRRAGRVFLHLRDEPNDSPSVGWHAFRACDLAAVHTLAAHVPEGLETQVLELFEHGDAEERRMILRALHALAVGPWTETLLLSAHRCNDAVLFEAAMADGDLPARVLGDEDYNRMILKAAFMDLPLDRFPGWEERANPDLSTSLLEFMTEREAAGRPIWADSLRLAVRAPVPGVLDRLRGDLWHGDDGRRLGAVRAALDFRLTTSDEALEESLRLRQSLEPSDEIRRALKTALGS
ncbi:MAG TPA: hypothetical protein ENK43_01030 [Planctomycetes bacterium]|nr:hypothetical protein [Planctomycetota bacterium]